MARRYRRKTYGVKVPWPQLSVRGPSRRTGWRSDLSAPSGDSLKARRDRAILAALLYHGIRREELVSLKVRDLHHRGGVMHFRIKGERDKQRSIPVALIALRLIQDYLEAAGHAEDLPGPLFRPVKNNTTGTLRKHLNPCSVYESIVKHYAAQAGILNDTHGLCVHSLRATAATNALEQ